MSVMSVIQNNLPNHRETSQPQISLTNFSKSWARPLTDLLQVGQTLTRRLRIELAWKPISYLDGLPLFGLAGSTDVVTSETAEDLAILRELVQTNLRNKTLREFV